MDHAEFLQTLNEVHSGLRLSAATIMKLAGLFTRRDFPAGGVVFEEGARHPWLHLIASGQVALEMCVPARGCTRILTLGPGDLLAWSALLGNGRMTAAAVALVPTATLVASGEVLNSLCESDRDFGYEWMHAVAVALAKRLTATRLQLLDLYGDVQNDSS